MYAHCKKCGYESSDKDSYTELVNSIEEKDINLRSNSSLLLPSCPNCESELIVN